ncbi:MAG: GntR family transcriptional regulator [Faecousia sp.]
MNWKFTGDRPVYQQIMAAIRGVILKGELAPGKKVPSVRDLAAEAQVNPNTMQRALTELEREGLLISGGTSGRSVTEDQAVLDAMREAALRELARECAEKFMVFGVTPTQAAQLLLAVDEEKEEA